MDWAQSIVSNYLEIKEHLEFEPQLIIVNDGSDPNLKNDIAFIKQHIDNFLFINNKKNNGKGYALRAGVAAADATYYIYTDIDFPYTSDSFIAVYEGLLSGHDVVAGVKNKTYYNHIPFVRKQISKVLRFFIRTFLQLPITDTQCGLKGFNNKGKKAFLATTIDRYLFDLEFIYITSRKNNKNSLQAIASQLKPNIIFRKMNLKIIFQEGGNFLKILLK